MKVKDVVLEMHQGINTVADKVEYVEYGIPIIQSKNFTKGYLDLEDVRYLNKEDENKYIEKYSPHKADILLANIGTIGKSYVIKEEQKFLIAWNVFLIKPNREMVLSDFLKYYFDYLASTHYFEGLLTGGTVKFINKAKIGDIALPDINIDKQTQICNLLCAVEELIIKKEKELQLLDELIKARFVEIFGTPYGNEKGFPMKTVDEVIEFTGGAQPDKKYFEYEPSEDNIRLIQIRDYKTDNYITYIPKSMAKRFCDVDDIMIGRYGPPIFQILKGIEGSYNVALMKATPKMGNKEFVRHFLMQDCLFNYLDGLSQRTAGQSGIEMPALKAYPFPYPPIELQNQFAEFVEQVDKSKVAVHKSLEETQLLFDSLMQEYFG